MKLADTKLESSEVYLIKYGKICCLDMKLWTFFVEMRFLKYVRISKDFTPIKTLKIAFSSNWNIFR